MALVKLGSGSNLLGYYMYHGGTNPEGKTYLNENQRTKGTNYNDMPVKNYDFQAPLGEFGQKNAHYYICVPCICLCRTGARHWPRWRHRSLATGYQEGR